MSKVYTEQTDLTLYFEAGKALNTDDIVIIEYLSPRKEKGFLNALVYDALKGIVVFNVNSEVSEFKALGEGTYTMWLKVTDSQNGLISYGEPASFKINKKGT